LVSDTHFREEVADVANTMPRSLRIPDDVWRAAVEKAHAEGTTVTAVVVKALERYNRKRTP
jgi:hypothetical protein